VPVLLAVLAALLLAGPTDDPVPAGLRCLEAAYPDAVASVTPHSLTLVDGTAIPWDDGRRKSAAERLSDPDLEDMFAWPYPAGAAWEGPPLPGHDPGRIRHATFFSKLYGASRAEVAERVVTIRWMPETGSKKIRVTTVGGVHEQVRAISDELDRLPAQLRRYAAEPSSFNWRKIEGTDRLSAHAYGIAIDVGVRYANYWRWDRGGGAAGAPRWRNRIPSEIVEVFERHGFIWGGKWTHYDTMHFEYRPELLHPLCAGE